MKHFNKITCVVGTALGLFPFILSGQTISIERQVISSAGDYVELPEDINISYTVGEMAVKTRNNGTYYLTEGFQQPNQNELLLPILNVRNGITEAQCPDVHDGVIEVTPSGCQEPYSIELAGNGDTILITDVTGKYTFTDLDSGTYRITVRGYTFCTNRNTVRLELKNNSCGFNYYTGITPNGDGNNDYWIIDNIEINQPNEVKIFNRWGQLVWSASNYNNYSIKWGGNNNDEQPLPNGTYFFTIEIPGNNDASKSGWIQLIK